MKLGASELFTVRQLNGLQRVGDLLIPANGNFPAFSATGCIERIDDLMGTAHPDDVRDLGYLLLALNYLPLFVIHWLLNLMSRAEQVPAFIAPFISPLLRQLNVGLKGVVFSLYYSGYQRVTSTHTNTLAVIDYQVHCAPDQPH
ncbi:MAG TPA: hypothetical protein VM553_11305 [Dongiaceae bacterium]|nr:hypothetical protein [Dongiaceae bacterium]